MRRRSAAAIALVCACAAADAVQAQTPAPSPRSHRFEAAVGAVWIGSANMGSSSATESVSSGPQFVLFSTSTELDSSPGVEGRFGFHVTPVFKVDGVASYSTPQLTTTISGDTENGTPTTTSVGVKQLTIGGSLVAHLRRFHVGSNGVPFVEGGVALLRQVYDAPSNAANGQMFEFGGGVKYVLSKRSGGGIGALGVRGDIRAVVRRRGVAPDGGTHVSPAAGASLFVSF